MIGFRIGGISIPSAVAHHVSPFWGGLFYNGEAAPTKESRSHTQNNAVEEFENTGKVSPILVSVLLPAIVTRILTIH